MKKETLIKVIDEEFGDEKDWSWLIDVFQKACLKNDGRITECTNVYEEIVTDIHHTLNDLYLRVKQLENEEIKNGVRILHKRKDK
jgi:hypothetical protein